MSTNLAISLERDITMDKWSGYTRNLNRLYLVLISLPVIRFSPGRQYNIFGRVRVPYSEFSFFSLFFFFSGLSIQNVVHFWF